MKNVEIVNAVFVVLFLSILSVEDIKYKQVRMIHFVYMCPMALIIAFINFFCGKISVYEIILGIAIVFVIAIVGNVSQGLGAADILTMLIVGIISGGERLFAGIIVSLLLVYVLAIIMMFKRKLNKRTTFPYIPFLNIGMICIVLQGI